MIGFTPPLIWAPTLLGLFFFFALGAIVGSFLNVVAYRLPRGEDIVRPPSACPACGVKLGWSENMPIVGWLRLGGRCRFCKSPISVQYPIVESLVALLFAALYALWYLDPGLVRSWGVDPMSLRPAWTIAGLKSTWPMFALTLSLVAALVAMTLIDAKTFMIPLGIPWLIAGVALLMHPAFGLWTQLRHGRLMGSDFDWTIWTFDGWSATLAAVGAAAGLIIATALLRAGLLRRSFADYEDWERQHASELQSQAQRAASGGTAVSAVVQESMTGETPVPPAPVPPTPAPEPPSPASDGALGPILMRTLLLTGPALTGMAIGFTIGLKVGEPIRAMIVGMAAGLIVGLFLRRLAPDSVGAGDPIWVQYPHARREMIRELLFLAPALTLGVVGYTIAANWTSAPPLWIKALTGSMVGLLAGGGIVWVIRILGTLAFGKEAMGLGDVHLMAAVGAVLGFVDPILAFFIAPFSGIAWTLGAIVWARLRKKPGATGTALPYGPHLAVATILVIYARPAIEVGLSALMSRPIDLP